MSAHDHNMILIAQAEDIEQINQISVSLGHSEREFAVPLSPTGKEPATHYACSPAVTRGYALMMMTAPPAPEVIEEGDTTLYVPLPAETVDWLRSTLTMSVQPPLDPTDEEAPRYGSPREHFEAVIAEMGLKPIEAEP